MPVGRRLSGKAGIAGKIESRRSIGELRALDAFQKTIHVEDGNLTVRHGLRKERLPPQSIVERQARRYFPRIGEVQIQGILACRVRVRQSLKQCVQIAQKEVTHSEAGHRTIEVQLTGTGEVSEFSHSSLPCATAERNQVRAARPIDIVVDSIRSSRPMFALCR